MARVCLPVSSSLKKSRKVDQGAVAVERSEVPQNNEAASTRMLSGLQLVRMHLISACGALLHQTRENGSRSSIVQEKECGCLCRKQTQSSSSSSMFTVKASSETSSIRSPDKLQGVVSKSSLYEVETRARPERNATIISQKNSTHRIPSPPQHSRRGASRRPSPYLHTPMYIHHTIAYDSALPVSKLPLHWNMLFPPHTALFALAANESACSRLSREVAVWKNGPGISATTPSSVTIWIVGVERPVVVFPTRTSKKGTSIRIIDVLRKVYNALRLQVFEAGGGCFCCSGDVGAVVLEEGLSIDELNAANAIREYFGGEILLPDLQYCDVGMQGLLPPGCHGKARMTWMDLFVLFWIFGPSAL